MRIMVRPLRASGLAAVLLLTLLGTSCRQPKVKTADDFHREGILQIQKDDLQGALENLDQAVMLESSNPTMLVNRGLVHDELGKYELAIADYTAALERDETLSEAYYNRANAHHNLKQYEESVADYSKAIEQREDFAYAYVNRAINLEDMGEDERAIADLAQAVEIFERTGDTADVDRIKAKMKKMALRLKLEL